MINEAYIGLGSNLGNSCQNLCAALELMRQFSISVESSPFYRTTPQGFRNQPAFYNAACRLETKLTPFQLMERLLIVESMIGRKRIFHNAPRVLDLDILLYNRLVLDTPPLTLPHPRMHTRGFVLRPLADIAPRIRHPLIGLTAVEMLRRLPPSRDAVIRLNRRGD